MQQEIMNTINLRVKKVSGRGRSAMVPFAMLAIWATNGAYPVLAQQSAQPTFPSAAEASQNLFQAVQGNDEQAIVKILGGPTELTTSRDEGQDKRDRELFVQKYQEMHRLCREPDGSVMIYIGAENWPFPVPLVEKNGAWQFDSVAGQKEVMYRRIGENELTAIAICHGFATAEKQYRAKPGAANLADSSPASLVARVTGGESTDGAPALSQGYYFRILGARRGSGGKSTGGLALIAYPEAYRSTGVMTFIVTENGVVYEKDLGDNTSKLASEMTAFHKDATWRAADR